MEAEDKENQLFLHEYHLYVSNSQERQVAHESLNKQYFSS